MDSRDKKELCFGANSDIISNLPDNVIDRILVCLPILNAVRTSVLSTKWRYKWTTIPELVFHDNHLLLHNNNNNNKDKLVKNNNNKDKLVNVIDRVLLLHSGFIHKFELSTGYLPVFSTIDCWILFLLRKNIKEFVLKFFHPGRNRYKLPTCFFFAQQISTLELCGCVLKPPPTFIGFSNLKTLSLYDTTFVDKCGFKCLISKCPLLERLTLNLTSLDHIYICSPNLKYLSLYGAFQDICFENTSLLSDLSIVTMCNISNEKFEEFRRTETRNVVKVLSSLPNLRKCEVGICFLKFLTVSEIPEKLPFTCHHLTYLSMELNFECVNDICITLCLLNSSPNLRELQINSSYLFVKPAYNIESFWKERAHIDWNMSGLQVVKITDIQGFELELEFIKLLLAKSPMLEVLSIRSGNLDIQKRKGLQFLKELLTFPRASPKARIKFFEQDEK